jgi:hypothetical protein
MDKIDSAIPSEVERAPDFNPLSRVPIGCEMLLEVSSFNLRIKCELVGMKENHFIILMISRQDVLGNFVRKDIMKSPCAVLFNHNDSLFLSQTTILNLVTNPSYLLFLSYPRKLKKLPKVNNRRFRCALPTMARLGTDIFELVTTDISKGGCLCRIEFSQARGKALYSAIQVDKVIELLVKVPDTGDSFKVTGFVRNVSKKVDKITFGVMFASMTQGVKKKLDKLLV